MPTIRYSKVGKKSEIRNRLLRLLSRHSDISTSALCRRVKAEPLDIPILDGSWEEELSLSDEPASHHEEDLDNETISNNSEEFKAIFHLEGLRSGSSTQPIFLSYTFGFPQGARLPNSIIQTYLCFYCSPKGGHILTAWSIFLDVEPIANCGLTEHFDVLNIFYWVITETMAAVILIIIIP